MYTKLGAEQHRTAEAELFGIENSYKALKGRYEALITDTLWNEKAQREQKLRLLVPQRVGDQRLVAALERLVAVLDPEQLRLGGAVLLGAELGVHGERAALLGEREERLGQGDVALKLELR